MRGGFALLPLLAVASLAVAQAPEGRACTVLDLPTSLALAADSAAVLRARLGVEVAIHELAAASNVLSGAASVGTDATWRDTGVAVTVPIEVSLAWTGLGAGPAADSRRLSTLALDGAVKAYYEAWSNVTVAVVRDYLAALRAEEEVVLAEYEQELARERAAAVAELGGEAAVRPTEVSGAELTLERAELTVFQRRLELTTALAALRARLGCIPETLVATGAVDLVALLPQEGSDHGETLNRAATSAEVDAAAAVVAAEIAQTRARREAGMTVEVSAAGRLNGPVGELAVGLRIDTLRLAPTASATYLPVGGSGVASSATLGLEISVPIGGATGPVLAAAEARLARAELALEASRADARAEVDRRIVAVELEVRRSELARSVLDHRLAELADVEARYQLGLVTSSDVLVARLAVERAELEVRRADDAVALAQLELAIARGHVPMRELIEIGAGE